MTWFYLENISCDVVIQEAAKFSWETNREDCFSFRNNTLTQTSSNTISIGNSYQTVISSGRNIVIGSINGEDGIWVNGNNITKENSSGKETKPAPKLTIKLPRFSNLSIETCGSACIQGEVLLMDVNLDTSGSSKIELTCMNCKIDSSGSSRINLTLRGRQSEVKANCSGSTKLNTTYLGDN